MATVETIIVGAGIKAQVPFTVGYFPAVVQSDPATVSDGNIRQDTSVPPKVYVGEAGLYPKVTVLGGATATVAARRSVVIGDGANCDSAIAGPDSNINMHVVIGCGANQSVTVGQGLGNVVIGGGASNNGGSYNIVIGSGAIKSSLGGANIVIGNGISVTGLSNNLVAIGSGAAVSAGGDIVSLGASAAITQPDSVGVGSGVAVRGRYSVVIGSAAHDDSNQAFGRNVVIGTSASVGTGVQNSIAVGFGSHVVNPHANSIVIGAGQVSTASKQLRIGNNNSPFGGASAALVSVLIGGPETEAAYPGITYEHVNGVGVDNAVGPLTIVAPRSTGAALPGVIKLQVGVPDVVSGAGIQAARTSLQLEPSAVADETDLLLYDVTAAAVVRVTRGPADSGGVGFRVLRVPN